jgi:hypothetical protein
MSYRQGKKRMSTETKTLEAVEEQTNKNQEVPAHIPPEMVDLWKKSKIKFE